MYLSNDTREKIGKSKEKKNYFLSNVMRNMGKVLARTKRGYWLMRGR